MTAGQNFHTPLTAFSTEKNYTRLTCKCASLCPLFPYAEFFVKYLLIFLKVSTSLSNSSLDMSVGSKYTSLHNVPPISIPNHGITETINNEFANAKPLFIQQQQKLNVSICFYLNLSITEKEILQKWRS